MKEGKVHMITVQDLIFSYMRAKQPTLKSLDFQVQTGEIFGFLGPSGAGKSTTQKILIGLLKDYQGEVQILGRDLKDWGSDYYERIGVSFELPNHFLKLTAVENLTYFGSLYSRSTYSPQELLEMVNLGGEGSLLVSQFSKGMKNRLNVARSLVNSPDLLFLDEPTSGLDPVNSRRIKDLIKQQQKQGRTIFLTTHDMHVAEELCDRVAFIVDGEIKVIDAPSTLKLRYGTPSVQVEYHLNSHTARAEFSLSGLGKNQAFLELLRKHEVQTIHTQEASLEEIFIRVTGRSLV
jgi:fluoroquinolone transport system ATP-binding protein